MRNASLSSVRLAGFIPGKAALRVRDDRIIDVQTQPKGDRDVVRRSLGGRGEFLDLNHVFLAGKNRLGIARAVIRSGDWRRFKTSIQIT